MLGAGDAGGELAEMPGAGDASASRVPLRHIAEGAVNADNKASSPQSQAQICFLLHAAPFLFPSNELPRNVSLRRESFLLAHGPC